LAPGYPNPVENVLGLAEFALFIVCVVALAASVTWLVVRLSPKPKAAGKKPETG
jgi:hypothetical protein